MGWSYFCVFFCLAGFYCIYNVGIRQKLEILLHMSCSMCMYGSLCMLWSLELEFQVYTNHLYTSTLIMLMFTGTFEMCAYSFSKHTGVNCICCIWIHILAYKYLPYNISLTKNYMHTTGTCILEPAPLFYQNVSKKYCEIWPGLNIGWDAQIYAHY